VTVVAVGSVRSCAVTTTAAGLAMVWPGEGRRVLIEADPAGGTLAAACGLLAEPGLVSLAAAARRLADPAMVFDHAQRLAEGTAVVCAPPGGDQARSVLSMLGSLIGQLGGLDAVVVVDCGRLEPNGPGTRLFREADVSVLVCRPQLGDLSALAAFLEPQAPTSSGPLVVLAGPGPYRSAEIADTLRVEVVGQLPWDPEAAGGLMSESPSSRRLTRSPLVRALRSLADDLAGRIRSPGGADPSRCSAGEVSALVEVAR
jgi:MinD-like ATPase involved in chromosome partitioning or flagellar assembly